ncbi:MAG: DUF3472 domain-containing protein [Chitinophagaceae bacterium]
MRKTIIFALGILLCTMYRLSAQQIRYAIPVGGNSWVTTSSAGSQEKVTNSGWQNWQHADAVWSTYVKIQRAGSLQLSVLLNVPEGESKLSFSIDGKSNAVSVKGATDKVYTIGSWNITTPGYIKIETRGLQKTGNVFANVKELQIEGGAVDSATAFVKNNEGNYFYWGRRGPSVHINYDAAAAGNEVEWFYNEITVPAGNDVIGSYFMADGFAEGYFGMQVNSATERRIIFSVWSPFKTDNPKEIPADQKIILVKKGQGVDAGEFGNEGSGGHSHLVYNWKAGETYKFLLHGKPVENNYTSYTAYFYDPSQSKWILIASFNRPATTTYLKRLHSFLENFIPETGNLTRMAYYHNQWVKPVGKDWQPLTTMFLTADATAQKKYRLDYGGGIKDGKFFMQNGGFFNESAELRKPFTITAPAAKPLVNFEALEK